MAIKADYRSFRELLGSLAFDVPDFQREYAWTKENLEDMLDDAISSAESGHFLGSVIVYTDNSDQPFPQQETLVRIVDGQQRLTTLMIVLAAIRSMISESKTKTIDKIDGYLNIYSDSEQENRLRSRLRTQENYFEDGIILRHHDQSLAASSLNKDSIKRMDSAYENSISLIRHRISSNDKNISQEDALSSILTKILNVNFVIITLESLAEAYAIFQTVNARGVELATIDLVKSDLFSYAACAQNANPTSYWKEAQTNWVSTGTEGDEYFQTYWYSRFGYIRQKDIFQSYKKLRIGDPEKALDKIKEIKEDSLYYKAIYSPESIYKNSKQDPSIADICDSIYAISSVFKNTQVNPLLLSLIRKNQEKKIKTSDLRDFLDTLEKYLFHIEISGVGKGGGRTQKYAGMAGRIFRADTRKKILDEMGEIRKEFSQIIEKGGEQKFIDGFKKLEYGRGSSNGTFIRYTLYKLAKYYNLTIEAGLDWRGEGNATVEHIVPIEMGKDGAHDADKNAWTVEIVSKIPNLILVSKKMNDNLGNLTPRDKLNILKSNKFNIYPYLEGIYSGRRDVSVKDIDNYNSEIAKEAYRSIWSI